MEFARGESSAAEKSARDVSGFVCAELTSLLLEEHDAIPELYVRLGKIGAATGGEAAEETFLAYQLICCTAWDTWPTRHLRGMRPRAVRRSPANLFLPQARRGGLCNLPIHGIGPGSDRRPTADAGPTGAGFPADTTAWPPNCQD